MDVDVTVKTNTECAEVYGKGLTGYEYEHSLSHSLRRYILNSLSRINICASDSGKDSCQGDSGGPLITKENDRYAVIGVVSYGIKCAEPKYPGVYARVTANMDWIKSITSGTLTYNTKCQLIW